MKALAQTTLLYQAVSFLRWCVFAFVLEFPFH